MTDQIHTPGPHPILLPLLADSLAPSTLQSSQLCADCHPHWTVGYQEAEICSLMVHSTSRTRRQDQVLSQPTSLVSVQASIIPHLICPTGLELFPSLIPHLQPPLCIRLRLRSLMSWGDAQPSHFLLTLTGSAQILHTQTVPTTFLFSGPSCLSYKPVSDGSFSRAALTTYSSP